MNTNPIIGRKARVLTRMNAENMMRNLTHPLTLYTPEKEALAGNLHDAVITILDLHRRIEDFSKGIR